MSQISSAGVFIFEITQKKFNLLLVHDVSKQALTDPGGKRERNASPTETAINELYEETACLFNVCSNVLDIYVDIEKRDGTYHRCFVLLTTPIQIDDFSSNLRILRSKTNTPKKYLETDRLVRLTKNGQHLHKRVWKFLKFIFGNKNWFVDFATRYKVHNYNRKFNSNGLITYEY